MVSLLSDKEECNKSRTITEEKRNLILDLYWNRNIGLRKIASFVGISTMTVWREVRKHGMPSEAYERLAILKG